MTEKHCDRCGSTFDCGASVGGCWCDDVTLSQADRDALAARYDDCLCPTCLRAAAAASAAPSV